jgi:hypothetical protein
MPRSAGALFLPVIAETPRAADEGSDLWLPEHCPALSCLGNDSLACGLQCRYESGPIPPKAISVSFLNQPVTSLNVSTSTGVIAIVSNDTNNAGVTWKVSCGGSSCGTINPTTRLLMGGRLPNHRLGEWSMILRARQSAAAIVT